MSGPEIREAVTEADWAAVRAVRQRVFVEEQACPPEEEWDTYDAPEARGATVHHLLAERDGQPTDMFVVRRDAVFSVSGGGLRHEACRALNEAAGCETGCCCLSEREELVVGRREAVYFYSAEERGPCFAFDGEKAVLSWHRGFLLVASRGDGS